MGLPVREVGLEEGSILGLIRDYFEVAGHAECLLAMEQLCRDGLTPHSSLPLELAVLREIVLAGRWDQLTKYLDRFSRAEDQEGLKRCRYLAHKQKYLEILQHVESDIEARIRLGFGYCENGQLLGVGEAEKVREVMETQLTVLEPICPMRDDYNSLKMLLSLPSISSSKEYSDWQLHSGRLATLRGIQEWVAKALYLNVKLVPQNTSSQSPLEATKTCALLRLLAKGLLYEQCEQLCRARCGEGDTSPDQAATNMLDLRGWIQQQPDSSFQLPPAELSLVVSPWARPGPPCIHTSQSVDMGERNRDSGMEPRHNAASAISISGVLPIPNSELAVPIARTPAGTDQSAASKPAHGDNAVNSEPDGNSAVRKPLQHGSTVNGGSSARHHDGDNTTSRGLQESVSQPPLSRGSKRGPRESTSHPAVSHGSNSKPRESESISEPRESASHPAVSHGSSNESSEPKESGGHPAVSSGSNTGDSGCASATCKDGEGNLQHTDAHLAPQPQPAAVGRLQNRPAGSVPAVSAIPAAAAVTTTGHKPAQLEGYGAEDRTPPNHSDLDRLRLAPAMEGVFLSSTTPLHKPGRGSSTPKNIKASRASLKTSPPSSPIASNLAKSNAVAGVHAKAKVDRQGARKKIDFHSGPAVKLLSTVTDSQVVRSVAFSESGKMVAVGANSGTLRLFNTTSLIETNINSEDMEMVYQHTRFHRGSIYCIAWYGDTMLASGSNDKTVSLLTISGSSELSFKAKKPFPYNKGTIRDILFMRDGLLVYGGGVSPEIQVIDVKTWQSPVTLLGHTEQVLTLDVLPGGLLASGGQDKMVLLWDTRSQRPASTLVADSAVASMTSSGDRLITAHLDGSCAIYDLNMLKQLSTYSAHTKECRSVRYQPKTQQRLADKSWVLSGSYDKTVCLTNTEDLQWTKLCQHEDKVIQCRWHPQGNIFASTGADKKACFWSLGTV